MISVQERTPLLKGFTFALGDAGGVMLGMLIVELAGKIRRLHEIEGPRDASVGSESRRQRRGDGLSEEPGARTEGDCRKAAVG
ncbi:hypothetical protein Rmf_39390 [Roseomonas fluvialis]|uniref:Uncharacterized protein n=1 Tax=Roseomonas fluvialis TaxID=1750527 RepID=A0ABN6P6Q8_9PROT|nr:hypothetical protein Rmf_39390 [Roseomonas fluvialis]